MESKSSKKKKWMKWAKIGFVILLIVFIGRYFYKNFDSYKNLDVSINWPIFAVAVACYYLFELTMASLWHYLTKLNNCEIRYGRAVAAYLCSLPGKYIPGKVFLLLARIPAYEEAGKSLGKVTICFFWENISTILGTAFTFLISLFFFPNDLLSDYKWAAIMLVVIFFICLNPKIINFFLRILGKILKKDDMEIPTTYGQMIKVVLLFVIGWSIAGIGFYMLTCSVYPVPPAQMLYAVGLFGLSTVIGILALFAPSGLGVREGILVLGLSLIMPEEYAVIISIVSRLWITVSELSLVGITFAVKKITERPKREVKP